MQKTFTLDTKVEVVASTVVPAEYRLDFSGPAPVASVSMPYASLAPAQAEFAVDGDYVVTAGLYDDKAALVGATATANFNVANAGPGPDPVPENQDVNAVNTVVVS